MKITIDHTPPPAPRAINRSYQTGFREALKGLQPGASMLVENPTSANSAKVIVSQVKKELPGSEWTVRRVGIGDVRVWRLA